MDAPRRFSRFVLWALSMNNAWGRGGSRICFVNKILYGLFALFWIATTATKSKGQSRDFFLESRPSFSLHIFRFVCFFLLSLSWGGDEISWGLGSLFILSRSVSRVRICTYINVDMRGHDFCSLVISDYLSRTLQNIRIKVQGLLVCNWLWSLKDTADKKYFSRTGFIFHATFPSWLFFCVELIFHTC